MDALPLETLQRIFTLACTDDGHTGNALSLVSKSVRAASRTARFHTVSLIANPRRLETFLALYERECSLEAEGGSDKPHIRHLYATFPRIDGTRQRPRLSYYTTSLSPPPRGREGQHGRNRRSSDSVDSDSEPDALPDEQRDLFELELEYEAEMILEKSAGSRGRRPRKDAVLSDPSYHAAARRLFELVAPDLWTLVLQSGFRYGGPLGIPLFAAPFPALRSLTIAELTSPSSLFADGASGAVQDANQGSLLPALTHLHLLPYDHDFQLEMWAARAPRVTHLRISGQTGGLDQLARAVGVARPPIPRGRHPSPIVNVWRAVTDQLLPPAPPPPPPPPLFPQLQCLLVQPGPPPPAVGICGTPLVEYDQALQELDRFVEMCRTAGSRVIALPPRKQENGRVHLEEVRKEWLEVASETGAGAWAQCA
ncbi:hypothetical protein ONZ51_g7150 [Trametes cubensis]|uniref:Uncharacterized protein n=1 Tax=Trametes cubensis TaxID=1111947 RepID=A0AAD7TR61_9APHY|nr:hypothetical protein ONZ51_g7150 [Trametes cubensis]